jgi:signal transduction histidine kinase
MKLFSTVLFIVFTTVLNAQIDSLIRVSKKQTGAQKVSTLSELCFLLSTSDIDASIKYGRKAFSLANKLKDSVLIANVANDLSMPYLFDGKTDSCIYFANLSYKIRLKQKLIVPAYKAKSKMALAYQEKGDFKKALSINMEVEKVFSKNGEELIAAKIQNNIGNIFDKNKQVEESLKWFKKSAKTCLKFEDYQGYVTARANEAIALRKQGKFNQSENLLLELIPISEENGYPEQLSEIYQALGVLYREQNQTKKGLLYYKKSRLIYESIGTDLGLSSIDANIGNCYRDLGNLDSAAFYLGNSYQLSKKLQTWNYLKTPLEGLYELETKRKNYQKANEYLLELMSIKDSMYNESTQKTIGKLQVKYQTAEKEKQILKEKNKVKEKNILLLAVLLFSVFIALIAFYIIQQLRNKKRKLELENLQKVQNERMRISRDLHDNMGAEFTQLTWKIDALSYQVESKEEKLELQKIGELSRGAMHVLRETIWTISEEKIHVDLFGLKLKSSIERYLENPEIQFIYQNDFKEDRILSPEEALNILRIIKEATNNTLKYAQAKTISLTINSINDNCQFLFSDDGIGLSQKNENGYGLKNMKERSENIGAQFSITSSENGTSISIVV